MARRYRSRVRSDNEAFRAAILQYGLRQYEVAEELGIAESTLSRWLRWVLEPWQVSALERAIRSLAEDRGLGIAEPLHIA